jgi:hypothetical protein
MPVRQGERGITSPLRDGLELDTVVGQQAMTHMSQESLNAVED